MEGLLAQAESAFKQGYANKAQSLALDGLELVERAGSVCPGDRHPVGVGVLLSVFAGDLSRAEGLLARFEQATPYGERDPQVHYLRGHVQLRLMLRPDLALKSVERMQAVAPEFYEAPREALYYDALVAQAAVYARDDRFSEGVNLLAGATALARRRGNLAQERNALAQTAILLSRDDRHDKALEIWRTLRKADPESPIWSYHEGLVLAVMMRPAEAIPAYRHALEKSQGFPGPPELMADLARARLRLGNCLRLLASSASSPAERGRLLKEALEQITRYHQEQPRDALGALWVGVLHFEELDDAAAALPWFEKAFALDPDCESFLDFCLRAYHRLGGPPTERGRDATAEERLAWDAKGEAWKKDRIEGEKRRAAVKKARERDTGDPAGGCL
jgi:tetratricopeptide (TPR) repeat protein